jgi:hypothetical protein
MGGWDKTITQRTVIRPSTVKDSLTKMSHFVEEFNKFLNAAGVESVKLGHPTGSSAYYEVDTDDKVYGDIDLQLIVPEVADTADKTPTQAQGYWIKLQDSFVKSSNLEYVHPDSAPGHPIISLGSGQWVQIDLMPHTDSLSVWGRFRTTPERGVKGLLNGNMFSVLGEMLTMSIQHSGVQYKVRDGVKMPYVPTRKNYELVTITTDIENFVRHVFDHEAQWQNLNTVKVDPLLIQYPGSNIKEVKIINLVNAVKGLAYSFELNNMYGKGNLQAYSSADNFLNKFKEFYTIKAMRDINAAKRNKAETDEAKARAEQDRLKVSEGLQKVMEMF